MSKPPMRAAVSCQSMRFPASPDSPVVSRISTAHLPSEAIMSAYMRAAIKSSK